MATVKDRLTALSNCMTVAERLEAIAAIVETLPLNPNPACRPQLGLSVRQHQLTEYGQPVPVLYPQFRWDAVRMDVGRLTVSVTGPYHELKGGE